MLGTFFKTAFRNLLKNKSVSFINIVGLAIGLASCITILAYIGYELSYDRFHEKAGRIYRGVVNVIYSDSTLFDVFSFRFLQGNPEQALAAPFSIVLSEQTARKIFGDEDALGKTVLPVFSHF